MESRRQNYNIEDLIEKMDEKGKLTFDYPIQREDGQWDKGQKALLIDTVFNGYLIPDIYIVKEGTEDFSPMSVLDGKQRLTTLYDFRKDKFALPKDADDVVIKTVSFDEDKNPIFEENTYVVAGKKFSKIDPALQKIFNKYKIEVKLLAGYTDEQIEEQFYRLNNGCVFTKSQKANTKLGTDVAAKIEEIKNCDFFENRASFTNTQRKRGEVTSCILQTMMLLSGFEYKNFGANEVLRYANELNENPDYELIARTKELFDKLFILLPEYNKKTDKQFKKIHIPTLIMNLAAIEELDVDYELSEDEYTEFLSKWFEVWIETSGYMDFCGQGSTSKSKVEGRVATMQKELREYIIQLSMEGEASSESNQDENSGFKTAS